jgi:hypothetical protein
LQCLSALMGPRSVETTYDVRDLVVRWNKPEATIFDYGLAEPTGSADSRSQRDVLAPRPWRLRWRND